MDLAPAISRHEFSSAPARAVQHRQVNLSSAISKPSVPYGEHIEGITMDIRSGKSGRRVVRSERNISSIKNDNQDWLAAQIARRSVADVTDKTGMTEKAVQNIRRRQSKISFDNLVELCRADPEFAAAFAEHIGLIRPGEAEFAGALTQFANAVVRRGQT